MDIDGPKKRRCDSDIPELKLRRVSKDNEDNEDNEDSNDSSKLVKLYWEEHRDSCEPNSVEQTCRLLDVSTNTDEQVAILQKEVSRLKQHNKEIKRVMEGARVYKDILDVHSKIGPVVKVVYNFNAAPEGTYWTDMVEQLERDLLHQREDHNKELDEVIQHITKLQEKVEELIALVNDKNENVK